MRRVVKNMYAVFKFEKGAKKIDELYHDDIVSRQSIIKRDGKSLGLEDAIYVIVEGSEEAVKRAEEIAEEFKLQGEDADKIYGKIKQAEEEASMGMGAIFG